MDKFTTYYELLGIPTDASTDEIQKAYRKKAKEYHPDANGGTEESTQLFQRLGEAKDCLIDAEKRLKYDYSAGIKMKPVQKAYSNPRTDQSNQYRPRQSSSADAIWGAVFAALVMVLLLAWFFGSNEEESNAEIV